MTQLFSSSFLSPIAFFCYNRPDHTRRVLEALKANDLASESRLFIFSDAPKNDNARDAVAQVREYIATVDGFASVEIIEREKNYGCGRNIVDGITQVVNKFGKIIVVEDDILACPYFLRYMNDALELYKDEERVSRVSAHRNKNFAPGRELPQTFFLCGYGVWGWGTWQRAWKDYEFDAGKLLAEINRRGLSDKFNHGVIWRPWSRFLKRCAKGEINVWANQFRAVDVLLDRISLCFGKSLVTNIGVDGSGTHMSGNSSKDTVNSETVSSYEPLKKIPIEVDPEIYRLAREGAQRELNLGRMIMRKIRRVLGF